MSELVSKYAGWYYEVSVKLVELEVTATGISSKAVVSMRTLIMLKASAPVDVGAVSARGSVVSGGS